jgi:hypothetical protein
MVFTSDPGRYRQDLIEKGYAHLRGILSPEFVQWLGDFYSRALDNAVGEHMAGHIAGKKRQFVFDFPSEAAAEEFRSGMARLIGLNEAMFTISERHLKIYEPESNPWPAPHKDRAASQFSIGLPVHLPAGSTVCLFPTLDRRPNEEERAVFLTEREHSNLAHIYESESAIMLNEKVGDVVIFNGSSVFHERVRAAGTAVLYIKVNDQGRDPLGEDIYQAPRVAAE